MRPNGTYVGTNGKTLTLADLQKGGRILSSPFNGLGDPGSDDGPRKPQLSFHGSLLTACVYKTKGGPSGPPFISGNAPNHTPVAVDFVIVSLLISACHTASRALPISTSARHNPSHMPTRAHLHVGENRLLPCANKISWSPGI